MLFTSYEFLGFFAVLLVLYYTIPQKYQWMLLLAFSCVFYFSANPVYLIYISITILTVYLAGCMMDKYPDKVPKEWNFTKEEKKEYKRNQKKKRKFWMLAALLFNIGILAVVKYSNFVIENISAIFTNGSNTTDPSFVVSLILPMGISFYTFQAVGYLIDVYRGTIKAEKNPFKFALFISFFPQLIQGPISRYADLSKTLYEEHPFDAKTVSYGLQRILWGFFKKMVVADRLMPAVLTIIGDIDTYNGAYAFVGMVFYTIQLYADFTGGIDVTIGIGQALGIIIQENFRLPYFSTSLKEYWRRWHISMCSWFRDYIFYPLSSSKTMTNAAKVVRKKLGNEIGKRVPVYVASFVVWFTTGIWHGASWNFIAWGLANYVVLMASQELEPLYEKFHARFHLEDKPLYRLFQVARTFLLICALNLFDCYVAVSDTFRAFATMFTASNWEILWNGALLKIGLTMADYAVVFIGVLIMLAVSLIQTKENVRDKIASYPYPVRFAVWFGLFIIVLIFGAYGIGYDSSQFIYNQF